MVACAEERHVRRSDVERDACSTYYVGAESGFLMPELPFQSFLSHVQQATT